MNQFESGSNFPHDSPLHAADREAIGHMLRVRPCLVGIATAGDVIVFEDRTLLHAGPPVGSAAELVTPLRHSALLATLFEGWANDRNEAQALLDSGAIALRAAQDRGAAIPLADVLSPSMAVLVVRDGNDVKRVSFSTLNGGDGPVMRVGQFSAAALERLQWLNGVLAPQLKTLLHSACIDLISIADTAMARGEDCHGSTREASALLTGALLSQRDAAALSDDVVAFLRAAPAFFLNAWMAAVKNIFDAAEGVSDSGVVTAIGGNGARVGIRIAGSPGVWFTADASAPLIPGATKATQASALGAIGDSAIVDAFGGGAMAIDHAPATHMRLDALLAAHQLQFPAGLLTTPHPGFHRVAGLRVGLCARRVQELGRSLIISLGALDREGERGRLDGGFYFFDPAPFLSAVNCLGDHHDAS